ncbi:hypothetical protein FHG87_009993 [Trinorchestia longiramus]|nr:hypothetical protein FHG87_009993 [Trinorchestia longiramus]
MTIDEEENVHQDKPRTEEVALQPDPLSQNTRVFENTQKSLAKTEAFFYRMEKATELMMQALSWSLISILFCVSGSILLSIFITVRWAATNNWMALRFLVYDVLMYNIAASLTDLPYCIMREKKSAYDRFKKRLEKDLKLSATHEADRLLAALKEPVQLSLTSYALLDRPLRATVSE